ncbi:MAG: winged helix-turn-helix transcriptional regulator [Nitrospirota bacterium]
MNSQVSDDISLRILDEVAKEPALTQRALAHRLGIALGLTNTYLKRLYNKGHIKIKTLPRNRLKYIITPKGLIEKTKLTYSYMHRSIIYFKEVRERIEHAYTMMTASGVSNVLLWGDGEIAELCYISTRGLPIRIIGVVDGISRKKGFFDCDLYTKDEVKYLDFDAVLIASIKDNITGDISEISKVSGISPDRVYHL